MSPEVLSAEAYALDVVAGKEGMVILRQHGHEQILIDPFAEKQAKMSIISLPSWQVASGKSQLASSACEEASWDQLDEFTMAGLVTKGERIAVQVIGLLYLSSRAVNQSSIGCASFKVSATRENR